MHILVVRLVHQPEDHLSIQTISFGEREEKGIEGRGGEGEKEREGEEDYPIIIFELHGQSVPEVSVQADSRCTLPHNPSEPSSIVMRINHRVPDNNK